MIWKNVTRFANDTRLPPKIFWAGMPMILTESLFFREISQNSGVHANLLQCPKGTDELKVRETLV